MAALCALPANASSRHCKAMLACDQPHQELANPRRALEVVSGGLSAWLGLQRCSFGPFPWLLFRQAVNLVLRRWRCAHVGGPGKAAAGGRAGPNR